MAKPTMVVYSPRAETFEVLDVKHKKHWDGDLKGKSVLFYWNSRPNGNIILEDLKERLVKKHGIKSYDAALWPLGRYAAQGLPDDLKEKFTKEVDVAVLAGAD